MHRDDERPSPISRHMRYGRGRGIVVSALTIIPPVNGGALHEQALALGRPNPPDAGCHLTRGHPA
jgi:hypothetical protein